MAVSSDCAEVGSCWFFSSCTLLLWTLTTQHHHIACTTVGYSVVTSPGRWRWCSSPSKTKPNLQPCDRPDDPNLGWFRAGFLLTKIECLMMFDAICFARIPHLPLWSSEHSLISAKPQALRTGTATYRATGRPNANTRLTLIDTFLQYRQMHYQEIRCSWNCFIWKLSADSLCVSLVCYSLFVFVSHLFPYDWEYSYVFNVFLKLDFLEGWVILHKGALARWFSLHSKFAVRFVGKGPVWNSADLLWEVGNYPIPSGGFAGCMPFPLLLRPVPQCQHGSCWCIAEALIELAFLGQSAICPV